MPQILGVYSKKQRVCDGDVKEILEDFSLSKKRKLQANFYGKILLSSIKEGGVCNNIVENEDRTMIVIFGGILYDFSEKADDLIKRDHKFKDRNNCSEFVLHSYEEYGESFLKGLNGVFGFAIYNKVKDELVLANDSFGLYSFFVYESDEHVIFCSEYEPITKFKKFDKKLNYNAVAEYFALGLPLGDKTFFDNISNLSPGSILEVKDNSGKLRQYDDFNIKITRYKDKTYFVDKIAKVFNKTVQDRMKNPENILMCNLTGGVDTRLILSNLTKEQMKLIPFCSRVGIGLDQNEDKDVIVAKMLARKLNLKLKVEKYHQFEHEFGVSFFKRQRITESSKRVLTGLFGGEFVGGYTQAAPIKYNEISKKVIRQRLEKIFTKTFLQKIDDPFISLKKQLKEIKAENKELFFVIRQLTRGFFTSSYGGSRAGWLTPYKAFIENSNVFCDINLLKMLLTVPNEYLADYNIYNQIYKLCFPELTNIPTNNPIFAKRKDSCMSYLTEGVEPKEVRKSKYNKALKAYLKSHYTWDKQFYNAEYIKENAKNEPHNNVICSFIDFEAWYRAFVLNK